METIMLTQSELKSLLYYNPDTGDLVWLISRGLAKKGDVAGHRCFKNTKQYIIIGVNGRIYRAHRLAWFYMNNCWPDEVDHINGDGTDNRWANLRDVDRQNNCRNLRRNSMNTSGCCGVSWRSQRNKWRAYIFVDNVQVGLGHFNTKEEAILVRKDAESRLGFHVNHGQERKL